jgi:hypothetical protein
MTGAIAAVSVFGLNALGVQDQFCSIPSEHVISDVCGALGLGGRPTRDERLAWESRPRGDCLRAFATDLRNHYRSIAADMLSAAPETRAGTFAPAPRDWRSCVRASERPFANASTCVGLRAG